MVAERVVAKELWAMLLYGFLQGSPVDIVEAVLEIDLDGGRHLVIITISKGLEAITSQNGSVVCNLNTSRDGAA
jgi:hypothetical protein